MTEFTLFNLEHSLTIIITAITFGLIIRSANLHWFQNNQAWIGRFIAAILIGHLIYFNTYLIITNQFSLQSNLPFHLCSISSYLIIASIISKNHIITKFTFFLTLFGPPLALVFPNLTSNDGWGSFGFTEFFVSHSFILFGWAYLWASRQFDIQYRDLWLTFGVVLFYAAIVFFVINPTFDANYIYLEEIPQNRSSIRLGAPPWHILNMGWILLAVLHVQYWAHKKTYPESKFELP